MQLKYLVKYSATTEREVIFFEICEILLLRHNVKSGFLLCLEVIMATLFDFNYQVKLFWHFGFHENARFTIMQSYYPWRFDTFCNLHISRNQRQIVHCIMNKYDF